ncbi:alpha/beta hydrolase [Saccharopolyspora endophytica]|uniref:Alpha/beta fold hydrolase n=1 Tax=Saccharopolyspora endophytica TaxID=543886 RepID=A0ABS5DDX6_9PSEU|nr:alpha/beta hydrolase [Saccharopolyspora endophytica]MBQ0924492.1 alpha/beta fold hydrolase [Saccharopolyspora endophytica]
MRTLRPVVALVLLAPLLTATPAAAEPPEFGACPFDGAECAELSVPLGEGDRSISIAISRVRATGTPAEHRGALLVNPGGPGGSGLEYAVSKGEKLPESVRRSYDIIGFDPRGVGRSAPLDCGELGGLFEHPAPEPIPADRRAESQHLHRLRAMAEDCLRHNPDAAWMNTTSTARDVDRIREALGEPKLNFLGVSYGSYLGAAYAAQFPDRVGRMVLDSVVSPDRWHDFDVRQAFAMLDQRDTLFEWIAARPEFGLGETKQQVRETYSAARAGLTGSFGPAEFDNLVYKTLSRTERWEPFARDLSAHVHQGVPLSPALPEGDPESRNYEAALRTVKCADSRRPTEDEVIGSLRALRAADPEPIVTGLEATTCAYWPEPVEPARFGHPGMPPVLLTQAEHDPTTPLDGARRMQARLPGPRMVTLHDSYSHGVFASQRNPCVDDAAANYLLTGELPADDLDCQGPGLP